MNYTNTFFRRRKPESSVLPLRYSHAFHLPLQLAIPLRSALGLLAFILVFAAGAGSLSAQTLLKAWDFGGNSGDEFSVLATTNAPGINATSGDVRRGGGLNTAGTPARANTFTARNWDGSDLATARGAADYYKITIRPSNGNCMTLTELRLYLGTFNGAPIPNAVVYSDAGGDNFNTPLGTFSVSGVGQYTVPLNGPGFEQVTGAISFRVYGFHDGSQGTFDQLWLGNTADNGIDDIEFYGYVAPTPGTLSTTVFDDPHCYGESQNTLRRLQVGGASLNANEVVVWRIVNFVPFPGSDTPAFASGEYTQADNSTTNDEFSIFNGGFSFRPSELATGVNNMPLYGTYEVEAFIRNTETGCEGGVLTGLTKTINQVPDISIQPFAQNPFNAVCLGEEARFLASPAAAGSTMLPPVQTYKWSFSGSPSVMDYGQTAADGVTKRNQGATYGMADLGPQTVDLDVTFTNGCTSTAPTHTITVNDNPSDAFRTAGTDVAFPFAETLDFDADHDACPGDVFEYGTEANTAGINNVSWTLSGGGNIIAGQGARNIQIEWTTPGTHTLSFLVTNIATGCTSANSLDVTVLDAPAITIGSFAGNPFDALCPDEQGVYLASISSSGPPPVASYSWAFSSNASSPVTVSGAGGGGTGQLATDGTPRRIGAAWASPGAESVNLDVTYDNGCSVSAPQLDVAVNTPPSDMFRTAGTDVAFPFAETLDFDADHDACPGDVFEYGTEANTAGINNVSWTLSGGGNIIAGQGARNIQIEWTTPGTHTLSFLVTNIATGCTSANSLDVTVLDAPAITIGSFGGNPFDEVCEGDQAIFLASISSSGPPPVANYSWSFSGSPVEDPGAGTGGTGQLALDNTPRRIGATWADAGSESVDLMVTYDNGCSVDAPTHMVTVNPLPTVEIQQFAGNPFAEVCSGGTGVYLANLGNPTPGGSVNSYSWSVSPAAPITLAGQSGDVSGRRRAEIVFPPNMGTAPVMYTVELTIEDANGCVNTATQVVEVRPELKLAFDFKNPPGFANNEICNGGTVDIDLDVLPGQEVFYSEGSDYEIRNVIVRHRTASASSFVAGYGPVSGGTLNSGDVISGVNETLSHHEAEPVLIQYNFVLEDLVCGTQDFRSVVVEVRPQLKLAFDFSAPPGFANNALCNGSTVDIGVDALPAQAALYGLGSDYQVEVVVVRHQVGSSGGYTNGYGPLMGGTLSNGDVITQINESLSHDETASVFVQYNLVLRDLKCGSNDFRSVVVEIKPQPKIGFVFKNPPSAFCPNSNEICNGDEVNFDLVSEAEGLVEGTDFEFRLLGAAYKVGGNCQGGGYTNGYGPVSGGIASGTTLSDYVATLSHGEADIVWIRLSFIAEDLSGCGNNDFRSVWVGVWPSPAGTISNSGPVCANADAFLTFEGTIGQPPYEVAVAELNGGNYTSAGAGNGNPFWTLQGLEPGSYTYTLTAIRDANGCETTGLNQQTTVVVLPEPVISCPGSIIVQTSNNGTGDCTASASWSNPTESAGACTPITLTISIDNGTPQTVVQGETFTTTLSGGEHTVTYVVTDGNNNQDDCSFTVTVEDDERPSSIALPDVSLTTEEDGAECPGTANTSLVVDQVNPIATAADTWSYFVHGVEIDGFNNITDNCSDPANIDIYVWEINEISTDACESSFKVFFRYYDEAGNWRQRGKEFTIVDDTRPSSIALQDMTFTTEDGATCPGSADTDLVVDQSNPIATAADNWSFTVHGNTVQGFNNITDNCSDPSEIEIFVWEINEIATGDCESSFKVFFRYFDACGNFRQRGQTFTIQDNTKPDFNKGGFSEEFTLTTEDGADCPANATVDGLETGDVLTPGVAVPFTVAGVSFTTPTDMVSDNCVAQSDLLLTVDVVNENVMNEGDDCSKQLRVRYKLEDGCGNQRFFTQEFSVTDNTKPDFNKGGFSEEFTLTTEDGADCPANATVDGLETGDVLTPGVAVPFTVAGVSFTTPTDMVSDNCVAQSDLLLTVDVVNENVMNEGDDCSKQLRVRYKLEDGCGNQRFFTQEFSVTDNTKPDFAVPADITIFTDADCNFDASVAETGDVTDITDNCTYGPVPGATGLEATFSDQVEAGNCEGEQIITRTWSVDDGCGNVTTKVQTITVEDNIDPEFTVPANTTIFTDANCGFNADPSETGDVEDESDNCTADLDATYSDEVEAGDCEGEQVITRTWSLTDDCGNTTTQVQIITVEDNTDPTFTVPDNTTIFTDADCDYDADPSITGTVDDESDNCSADLTAKYADVIVPGSCAGEVIITRTWTLTDDCGNVTEQDQIITVEDNTAPTPVCLNGVLIPLDPDGERTLVAEDVFDFSASFDNCSTVSVTDISPAIIDCDDVGGLTSIQVTASDDCGNEATCTATIEVSDITALPSPWEGVDIGNPGSGNTYSYNPCVDEFTIEGGAYNTPTPTDNLATISQTLCSNGNGLVGIQLKVESVSGGFGGVFIRESNAPNAKYVALLKQNDTNLLSWERRTSTGGSLDRGTGGATFPFWLRIFRQGNLIRAQYSNTGNNWIPYRQIYLEMGSCVEVGMVAYTTHPNGTVDAVFSNVQVAGSSTAGTNSLAVDQGSNGVLPGLDQEALFTTESMDLSVFPNPATDQLTLKFGTELPELSTITLRNQLGQIMKQEQLRTPDTQMDWDISNLSTGTYFLEVRTSDGAPQVVKFLKTR
ncbi:T9SS type A sorting domain-containing protein [Phaeodactylibacter xiamenensis]|uniref:T9SS type A sorting domain-containing protein n=1 Tax=Phaeodactylibacter xiamenensis TaxID=1524460 RepID=UPI0024A7F4B5|nr:T9SS type A sorting domain-containing protein [Phaeodactylibacter xiamenensis]